MHVCIDVVSEDVYGGTHSRLKRSAFSSAKSPCFAPCIPGPMELLLLVSGDPSPPSPSEATGDWIELRRSAGGLAVSLKVSQRADGRNLVIAGDRVFLHPRER